MSLTQLVQYGIQDTFLTGTQSNHSNLNINHPFQELIYYNSRPLSSVNNSFDYVSLSNKFVESKNIVECSICLDNNSNIITKCGHQYCKECFEIWYNKYNNVITCPYCRNNLSRENIYKLKIKNSGTKINIYEKEKK